MKNKGTSEIVGVLKNPKGGSFPLVYRPDRGICVLDKSYRAPNMGCSADYIDLKDDTPPPCIF